MIPKSNQQQNIVRQAPSEVILGGYLLEQGHLKERDIYKIFPNLHGAFMYTLISSDAEWAVR